ncbi:MAG: hypothetical protein AB1489_20165 [Acidobacteriota bacterium]
MSSNYSEQMLIANFEIYLGNTPLSNSDKPYVTNITVDDSVDLPSMFSFEIVGCDSQQDPYRWIDDEKLFKIGNMIDITLGYGSDLNSLINGEITSIEPEFIFNGLPKLIVRGFDLRHRLQRGKKTRTFVNQKDSDIVDQLATEAKLSFKIEDTIVTHAYAIQANQTDLEFIKSRAQLINFELAMEGKTLLFRPVTLTSNKPLTLTQSKNLLEFYPRLYANQQSDKVIVRGWDPVKKEAFSVQAPSNDSIPIKPKLNGNTLGSQLASNAFGSAIEIVNVLSTTEAEAAQIATAQFDELTLSFIKGEGICTGCTDLRSGKVITIEGVGERFSGQYYVTTATHSYDPQSNYRTHFTVLRDSI